MATKRVPTSTTSWGLSGGVAFDVVLCVEVTRLFRKPLEAEVLIDLVWSKKTSFHTILTTRGGYYDLHTSAGRKAVRDAVNAAAGESDNISDRVRLKKGALARRGKPNGGRRAYGYVADGITVRESEAVIIREMTKRPMAGRRSGPSWQSSTNEGCRPPRARSGTSPPSSK
ncbi:recombinase family protein [Streptomyces sp. NBC_00445]|uniref:recombinase family protein n=1 Tax=Streptomyces sp. NBC_00445 TaxID=2975745 RepID=UPI002E23E685